MATPIPLNHATFTLGELAEATGGLVRRGVETDMARSVTSDSRAVGPGAAFVALRGQEHDGHAFVGAAAAAGAGIVVVERGAAVREVEGRPCAVVEVEDTLVAWGALARAHLERWRAADPRRRVVAITGSAGKTTTKELVAALLSEVGSTHRTAGNLNNRIGVPAVIFALEDQRYCVLEMGMSLVGELDAIVGFARPDVSVVVNVGVAHSEGVGGREGVMREKGAVYRGLGPPGIAIVNADDAFVRRAAAEAGRAGVTFGRSPEADYRLADRVPTSAGSRVVVTRPAGPAPREIAAVLGLPGEAPALDFVAALAAAEAASGVALGAEAIGRALERILLPGRGTIRHLDGDVLVIDDTYNANPASMSASLATLAEIAGAGRRRVAILGEMRELGHLAEEEHGALGDAIAEAGVVLAIGCGGLLTLALERAAARGVEIVDAPDTAAAAAEALRRVRPGDAVLVKASRGVRAERVVDALLARQVPEVLPNSPESATSGTR
jgi:UDP-N-acetylmuramoyl-tripeptide--D-alanyl-D-alanine ligase